MAKALDSGRVVRGLVLPILLQVAASMARGVVPNLGSSCGKRQSRPVSLTLATSPGSRGDTAARVEPRLNERCRGKVFSYFGGRLQPCHSRHNSFSAGDRSDRPRDLHRKRVPTETSDTRVPRGLLERTAVKPKIPWERNAASPRATVQERRKKKRWQQGEQRAEPSDRRLAQRRAGENLWKSSVVRVKKQTNKQKIPNQTNNKTKESRSSAASLRPGEFSG